MKRTYWRLLQMTHGNALDLCKYGISEECMNWEACNNDRGLAFWVKHEG